MNIEEEKAKLARFLKTGIVVLSTILLVAAGIYLIPNEITVSNSSSGRELPIYCVNRTDKKVALTFDAAWGNEDTKVILDILKKHDIKVTFFMTGEWIEKFPEDVKAIAAAGHDLGNHSENHKHMSQLSKEKCTKEIMKPHEKVKKLTGKEMKLFRPPYGDFNNTVIRAARNSGYSTIQWDVDSLDWKDYGADSIVNTVVNHKHLGNGSIILCHNGAKFTKDALELLITELQEKGYAFVPVSELIYSGNYYLDNEGRQFKK